MDASANAYFSRLAESKRMLMPRIKPLLAECDSRPVGWGFIDLITRREKCERLIAGVTELGLAINLVTLWCNCTEENKARFGCPHGYGDPRHATGFFSEMCERDYFDVSKLSVDVTGNDVDPASLVSLCNDLAWQYVSAGMLQRADYSPCLVPGFWLCLPDHWRRQSCLPIRDV